MRLHDELEALERELDRINATLESIAHSLEAPSRLARLIAAPFKTLIGRR